MYTWHHFDYIFKRWTEEDLLVSFWKSMNFHDSSKEWPEGPEDAQCTAEQRVTLRQLSGQRLQIQVGILKVWWRLAVSQTTLRYNKCIIVHHDHIYVWSVAFILVIGKIWLWGLETCALNQNNLGIVLEKWIESSFWQFSNLFDR